MIEAGLLVEDVVVLIDREQGGAADLAAHGMTLHSAFTLREIIGELVTLGKLDQETQTRVERYLDGDS